MYKFEEGLAWYKNNREEVREFGQYSICFRSAEDWIENPTKEEYSAITLGAMKAYQNDEAGNELSIFSDFLAEGISRNLFSLDDIIYSSGFAIAEAALDNSFSKIKGNGERA